MCRLLPAAVVIAAVLAGCGAAPRLEPRPPQAKDATFVIGGQQVTLRDGRADTPAAPGVQVRTWIAAGPVSGELNGDHRPDTAVVLAQYPGGSGSFFFLTALLNDGTASGRATNGVLLGDRIQIKALSVRGGMIRVRLLTRSAGEPMAAPPTVAVLRRFRVQQGQLVAVN